MTTIRQLLTRDLDKKIEEIIQVDQKDDQSVFDEITEYVSTDSIRQQYHHLLKAVAEAPTDPHERIGVWISGFFGSGKSSFAKNLGYALQNRIVQGQPFADLFKDKMGDKQISDLLDLINRKTPTDVILFEVAKEADTRKVTQKIAELIYSVLLRELGYAEDFDIAELEIELESEGKLDEFIALCTKELGKEWKTVRAGAQKMSRASAILHKMDPKTYPSADSWAHSQRTRDASIKVTKVVERTFELWNRRRPGKGLVFIIDEVGQHVARSSEKIEDLRATIEEFGKISKNLLKAKKITAPCWVVVTSQEKLEEVVAAIDSKRVDIAKLQDRFHYRADLAPSDIREVATKRVLAKNAEGEKALRSLFNENQGQLNSALRLERTTRPTEITESTFIQFYPYPPHYIDMCINIMSGIRLQPGAPRHYGGSNRTIIKQAYEMLVSERTGMSTKPTGALVTLDKVFELVEGNLSNEKRTDIHQISQRFPAPASGGQSWELRVAKAICLLEFLRELPRTDANIAAVLVDEVGKPSPFTEVQGAVKNLQGSQFIRITEEGWKLQTAQEKNWDTERRAFLEPKPRERNEITRAAIEKIYSDSEYTTYRYKNRSFQVGISQEGGNSSGEGGLIVSLVMADDDADLAKVIDTTRSDSQQKAHENDLYWLWCLTPEIDELIAQVHASKRMVDKYSQLAALQRISPDEAACLGDERTAKNTYESRLRDKITEAMERGSSLFRGVQRDGSALGKGLSEVLKKLFSHVVPDLYPKLEMGSRPIKGDEAEQLLKASDLKALPAIFYQGDNGLGLVVKEGTKSVINSKAEPVREVLDYLKSEHSYGNKDSRMGKALDRRFGGTPYGWEKDMLQLILATLFRAGEIEVTQGGNRFHNYQDPASRNAFTKDPAFRSALFSPRQTVGLKVLTQAVQILEDLTGEEVDVEEGAISTAFKKLANKEQESLLSLRALAEAHQLPVLEMLREFGESLNGIQNADSDDCVRILVESSGDFVKSRDDLKKLKEALSPEAIDELRKARVAVGQLWDQFAGHPAAAELAVVVDELKAQLKSEQFLQEWDGIRKNTATIQSAYRNAYEAQFAKRRQAFQEAIEEIKNCPEWASVESKPAAGDSILISLSQRVGSDEDCQGVAEGKTLGKSTLTQMESDLVALPGLKTSALVKLQEMVAGAGQKAPVRKVRMSDYFKQPIRSSDDLEKAIQFMRESLEKIIEEGAVIILE